MAGHIIKAVVIINTFLKSPLAYLQWSLWYIQKSQPYFLCKKINIFTFLTYFREKGNLEPNMTLATKSINAVEMEISYYQEKR